MSSMKNSSLYVLLKFIIALVSMIYTVPKHKSFANQNFFVSIILDE